MIKRLSFALFALVLFTAATPATRVNLTAATTFNVGGTGASDIDGCGLAPAVPCATREFMWNQLVRDYDVRCQQVTIQVAAGVYTDGFFGQGSPAGLCTQLQISPIGGVSLAQTKQFRWVGDTSNPLNVVIRATNGPAFFPENGAVYTIEGFTLDGSGGGFESLTGASAGSSLGFGKNVFGCNPGAIDIQPGVDSKVFVFDVYTIDHTQCDGVGGLTSQPVNVANAGVMNIMGLSSPSAVSVGNYAHDQSGCIPVGSQIVSITSGVATMSKPATCSNPYEMAWFSTHLIGPSLSHIWQDRWSYVFYETGMLPGGPSITPHIQVTMTAQSGYWNAWPDYSSSFVVVDGGLLILSAGPGYDTVTWKGSVVAPANAQVTQIPSTPSYITPGYIANGGANDNTIVLTP